MKTFISTTILLLAIHFAFGQADTVSSGTIETRAISQIESSYVWQGACCDNYGKPMNPGVEMSQIYSVKKFKSKTPVDIHINRIKYGSQTISLDIHYQNKIEGDTKIILLNDTIGVKLTIGRTVENDIKKYVYRLQVFKKDTELNCWRPLTMAMNFIDGYAQTTLLNGFSFGYPGSKDYFELVDGWIKFD